MSKSRSEEPEKAYSYTDGGRSLFQEADGPEDTTVRPLRFKIPKPWPDDVPFPPPADLRQNQEEPPPEG